MARKTSESTSESGITHVTGTATKDKKVQGPKDVQQKNSDIQTERAQGKREIAKLKSGSWRKPGESTQFLVGSDSGIVGMINQALCTFFNLADCGYKKGLVLWTFPPSLDPKTPKKKHVVAFMSYHKIENEYVLVDVFDANTAPKKIEFIKAWMEKLGYRYTYIVGGDMEKVGTEGFLKVLFKDRLKKMDPKDKDYPKFKIPTNYQEAGLPIGGTTYALK